MRASDTPRAVSAVRVQAVTELWRRQRPPSPWQVTSLPLYHKIKIVTFLRRNKGWLAYLPWHV